MALASTNESDNKSLIALVHTFLVTISVWIICLSISSSGHVLVLASNNITTSSFPDWAIPIKPHDGGFSSKFFNLAQKDTSLGGYQVQKKQESIQRF